MNTLKIKNYSVSIEDKKILKNISLEVKSGEVHVIMGPNGTGKSTLLTSLMGHPLYTVESGEVYLNQQNILEMPTDERSRSGLFLAFQTPTEIPGVKNVDILREVVLQKAQNNFKLFDFINEVEKATQELGLSKEFVFREANVGFSGGEKKRNEIIQLKVLKPKFALLDEIDSGLDVDALECVGKAVLEEVKTNNLGVIIVTHYERILKHIKPDFVHVLLNGKIVKTGDAAIIEKINKEGYAWLNAEHK